MSIFLQSGKARPRRLDGDLAGMASGGHGRRSGDGSEQAQGSSCIRKEGIAVTPRTGSSASTSEQQVIKAKPTPNQANMQSFGCMEGVVLCASDLSRVSTCQHNRMDSCSGIVHGAVHGSISGLLLEVSTLDFDPDLASTSQLTRMVMQQRPVQASTQSHNGKFHVILLDVNESAHGMSPS